MIRNILRKGAAAGLAVLLAWPPGLAVPAWGEEPVTVKGVEVAPDQVRVRVSAQARYDSFVTANPPRLILQISGAEYEAQAKALAGKGKFLKGVRAGQFQRTPAKIARVVMDLKSLTSYSIAEENGVITVDLGSVGAALAAAKTEAVSDVPAAKPAAEKKPAAEDKSIMKEAQNMSTDASAELNALAASTAGEGGEAAMEAQASPAPARARAARGDMLSRLPRDVVSLDFDNTDIRDVLKLLAAKAKINIIYGPDVSGTLTLHLVDVPFNEAFRTALSMMGLSTTQVGDNILRVLTPAQLTKSQTAAATATRVIPLNYSKAQAIAAAVNSVRTAEGRTGSTIADQTTNSLIVTESLDGLAATERLIAQLDVRPKQVLIEAKLVEVSLNNSLNYGIQWDYTSLDGGKFLGKQGQTYVGSTQGPAAGATGISQPLTASANTIPPVVNAGQGVGALGRGTGVNLPASTAFGALTLGRITNNYFLNATLTAAAAEGKVKVLSDPKVATLNNQPADINVTTNIPYVTSNVASTGVTTQQVSYVLTGIQMTVTPSINADGRITLDINPKVSQQSSTATGNASTGAPAVDSRDAKTTILVRDGETVVIGGLIKDSVEDTISKIPLLGDIPILGWLFKKKSLSHVRTELLIFVTPKIMQD